MYIYYKLGTYSTHNKLNPNYIYTHNNINIRKFLFFSKKGKKKRKKKAWVNISVIYIYIYKFSYFKLVLYKSLSYIKLYRFDPHGLLCQNISQTFKCDNLVLVQNLESVISSPSAYKITNKNVLLIFTLSQLPSTRCQQDYKQQQNANSLQLTIKQILRFNISMLQAIVTIKKITASLLFGFFYFL